MGITSLDFGSAARSLGLAARLRGLAVPVFASPPSRGDLDRSIRRRNGSPIVSVRLKGRPRGAVLADMIEGIVVANYLTGARADLARSALWLAVDGDSGQQPAPEKATPLGISPPETVDGDYGQQPAPEDGPARPDSRVPAQETAAAA